MIIVFLEKKSSKKYLSKNNFFVYTIIMEYSIKAKDTNIVFPVYYAENEDFSIFSKISDRYKLILVRKGSGIISVNGKSYAFLNSAVLCFNESDSVELKESKDLETMTLYLHPSFVNNRLTFENVCDKTMLTTLTDKLDSDIFNFFIHKSDDFTSGIFNIGPLTAESILKYFIKIRDSIRDQKDKYWNTMARFFVVELLFFIYEFYVNIKTHRHDTTKSQLIFEVESSEMNAIINYIVKNYNTNISIPELTRLFNTNRNTLNKKFKSITGYSVINFLINIRIYTAIMLLRETDTSISEIVYQIGYDNITHFERIFKKYTTHTPTEYRKLHSK